MVVWTNALKSEMGKWIVYEREHRKQLDAEVPLVYLRIIA
jgi:hypothetical protein